MFNEQFTHLNLDLDETLSLCIIRFNSLSLSIKIQVSLSLPASLPPSICLSGHPSYPTALPLPSPLSLPMLTLSFYHELDQYSLFPFHWEIWFMSWCWGQAQTFALFFICSHYEVHKILSSNKLINTYIHTECRILISDLVRFTRV